MKKISHLKEMNHLIRLLKDEINDIEKQDCTQHKELYDLYVMFEKMLKDVKEERNRYILFRSCTLLFLCGVFVSIANIFVGSDILLLIVFSINAIGAMLLLPISDKSFKLSYLALLIVSFIMITELIF